MPGFFYALKFLSNNQVPYTSCCSCVFDLINARLSGVLGAKKAKVVQVIRYQNNQRVILQHIGSAHTEEAVKDLLLMAEEFVEKFVFTKFEPAGMVDHPNIKTTTSLVDFVFRCLAYEYLNRTDLVHVLDKPEISNLGEDLEDFKHELSSVRVTAPNAHTSSPVKHEKPQPKAVAAMNTGMDAMNEANKNMQSDAPACNVCGHITIRSGTCYKCMNCGNSLGCS